MKIKYLVGIQIVLVLLAAFAGLKLKTDLADGPRTLHRMAGMLAGVGSLASVAAVVIAKRSYTHIALAGLSLILVMSAGTAGAMLKETANYSTMYDVMRLSGIAALLSSVALLVVELKPKSVTHKHSAPKD
ncbi:hypothetical protein EKI60_01235 [Candidatus Saccharibacteria bacterium]|nr:MAG: hypothetical protein EKI60_01235 [Candidatus Saccharibacteria bacterium]TXG76097.1 MAG: hypothetical protein E6P97_04300 [Patescibacteria group bacterium]